MLAGLLAACVAACGGQAATVSPAPTAAATLAPAEPPTSAPTLSPDDLASLSGEHPAVPAGIWRWTRFEPPIVMTIDAGWTIGHRHDDYFDLFRGDSFPAIGFGQFDRVVGAAGPVEATDAATVVSTLRTNTDLTIEDVGPASLADFSGLVIDVHASRPQTPLFESDEGNFNFDPEFVLRYYLLDVDGGVLMISVATFDGELDVALTLADPVLASLRIVEDSQD